MENPVDENIELSRLAAMSAAELDALYSERRPAAWPAGCARGRLLAWVPGPATRHPLWRPLLAAMFQLSPFGLDYDRRCWFFGLRPLCSAHFDISLGASRWRPGPCYRLHYDSSSLPQAVRNRLYDEIKPLTPDLGLGLAGLHFKGRPVPVFYFALQRV